MLSSSTNSVSWMALHCMNMLCPTKGTTSPFAQNLGTIKLSNLCTKIIDYSAPKETAVCSLASIALPSFISNSKYNFQHLHDITKSNMQHRSIRVGMQGLTDVFLTLHMPFESPAPKELNQQISETIYHGALKASTELAEKEGPYKMYEDSPASKGKLQRWMGTSCRGMAAAQTLSL
ncbi:hypothetical protein B0H14DRAFT_3466245 [Mycena olivaceomarginata]|nr:hypothetical protein B0H14DRAFT_3466245 [Mycena olivaceomarginata]